ncbi:hypothetical protein C8R44DRAFT_360856 [Mycena epipterygia]|nr:hypothetical protein C8R44DRAFT_360856 [Mycena epipterygia]
MQAGPVLPQELFDLVIDHLFDDLESLRACAVVSSSFLHSSRPHIFANLRIGPQDREHSIDELHAIFAKFPFLAARVQSVHIWDNIMRRHSWIGEYPTSVAPGVAQFSRALVSLQRFSITIESGCVHWANISEALRESIHHTLTMQTLTCLDLTGIYGLPFTLFAHCPALKAVTLKWVTFDERDNLDFATTLIACAGSPPTQLEHLSIDLDTRMLELLSRWILLPESPLDVTRLKSFACTVDQRIDQALLDACTSIEHLELANMSGPLDLSTFARLRTLRINTVAPLEPRVRWLASSVSLPPQPLGLVLSVASESASPEMIQLAAPDAALALLSSIASMTLIWLPEDGGDARKGGLVDVSAAFAYRMPLMARRGTLRVLRSW